MDRSAKVLILISFFFLSVSSNLNLVDAQDVVYGPDSPVMTLTPQDFKAKVVDNGMVTLVTFYAPWCPPCQAMKPAWEQAAGALKGYVAFGAIDASKYKEIKNEYPVPGFPTMKVFIPGRPVADYGGGRDVQGIINYAIDQLKVWVVEDKLPKV